MVSTLADDSMFYIKTEFQADEAIDWMGSWGMDSKLLRGSHRLIWRNPSVFPLRTAFCESIYINGGKWGQLHAVS